MIRLLEATRCCFRSKGGRSGTGQVNDRPPSFSSTSQPMGTKKRRKFVRQVVREERFHRGELIHVTLENGETMLFDPQEVVDVCEDISECGEYVFNPITDRAFCAIKPDRYVLARMNDDDFVCRNTSKIVRVRRV